MKETIEKRARAAEDLYFHKKEKERLAKKAQQKKQGTPVSSKETV